MLFNFGIIALNMRVKYFLLGVVFTFSIIAVAVTSYFLGKSFKVNYQVTNGQNFSATPLPTKAVRAQPVSKKEEIGKIIQKALRENEYLLLEKYLVEPLVFRIENSGCCEPQTRSEAVKQLKYLDSAEGLWDFDQNSSVVQSLEASFPEHYSNAFIGVTDDGYSVAFQFNEAQDMITKVSLSASYTLLLE